MEGRCSMCGENSVRDDYENGRKIRVCFDCGSMENDTDELTSEAQFEGTTITTGQTYGVSIKGGKSWMVEKSSSKGKENGKKSIRNVGLQLNFTEDMIDEATELFTRVYDNEIWATTENVRKAWYLVCIYVSGRNHGYPLNIRVLGSYLNIDNAVVKFAAALKCLKKKYNVHLPTVDLNSETHSIFSNTDLPNDVLRMTQQLMLLLQKVMMTQGRIVSTCAVPCAYYAWKASDFVKNKKVSLAAFCRKFKLNQKTNYRKEEIYNAFKTMATEIPWLKASEIEIKFVELHLKDIIQYQSLLISESVQTALKNADDESDDNDNDKEPRDIVDKAAEGDDVHVVKLFRKAPRKRPTHRTDKEEEERIKLCKKLKLKSSNGNSDNDNDDDDDDDDDSDVIDLGSDDDTDHYILSSKEVALKQMFNDKML